jgi:hypothetical protein
VARGTLRSTIAEVTPLPGLAAAVERNRTGHPPGKIVLDLRAAPDDPPRRTRPCRPTTRGGSSRSRARTPTGAPAPRDRSGTYTILLAGARPPAGTR